jgi:hypothetical protein
MKTKPLAWIAVAGLLFSPAAFAQKFNLSIFAGKYTGTVVQTTPSETLNGTARVLIRVPRSGRTATIGYEATINGSVLPTDMKLAANKAISVTDLGVGIAGTNNAHPGTGRWAQSRKRITFSATNGDILLRGTARVRDIGRKRKLSLVLISSDAGGSFTYNTTLTARRPRTAS